jgi:lipoic acid synthetase
VKTGCMVGLGEAEGEVQILLGQVAETGAAMVTIGQYLRPSAHNLPVAEYVDPVVFERYREWGEALGLQVQAGPLVRSSFQAGESLAQALKRVGKDSDAEIQ